MTNFRLDPDKLPSRLLAKSRRGPLALSCWLLGAAGVTGALPPSAVAAGGDYSVQAYFSSEFHPQDARWFTNPWSATDANWRYKLAAQTPLALTQLDSHPTGATINVNPATPYQVVLGMGTSLEDTSVYALSKSRTDAQITQTLTDLIDPVNGIGMNLFRLCIGTSDFSDGRSVTNDPTNNPHGWYTYQDGGPTSPFSIQNDVDLNIIKVAQMARDVGISTNHPVKFFASAWSPPAWMKDSNKISGGNLLNSMVSAYAAYLRQFVQAYQAKGIPIYAITTGNEHYFSTTDYPSCAFTPQQEAALVKALTTEFASNSITTKIWILDHNYDYHRDIVDALNSLGTANQSQVDSVAYHHYSGKPSDMNSVYTGYPGIGIQCTEGSNFGLGENTNGLTTSSTTQHGMNEIVQDFRNGARSYVSWVTMTTQTPSHNQGLYNAPGSLSPTLFIRNNDTGSATTPDNNYFKIPEYYLYGQFMKFIQAGAVRIASDGGSAETTTNVAFKNPDGTIVIVVVNENNWDQTVRFVMEGNQFNAALPAATMATYLLKSGLAPSTLAPVAAPTLPNPIAPPTGTGTIVQEWFFNENGSPRSNPTILTNDSRYPNSPSGASALNAISTHDDPDHWGKINVGTRMCGCVVPSITGAYTFYVHGDGWAQLSLSTDATPAGLRVIATCPFYSGSFYQYLGPGQQASVPIQLVAGQKYYFETLQTGGGGNGQSAVAWDMPGIANGQVIAGKFLTPSTVTPPPVITSTLTASATTAVAFSYQATASNAPWGYTATGLPAGLTLNVQTGAITGAPTTTGTYRVALSAVNQGGAGSANLTITVSANASAPVFTSPTTVTGVVGTPFSYSITATNSPTSFGTSSLPAGLRVNTTTGVISGTPTTAAKSTITLSATNAYGTVTQSLVLTVTASAAPTITSATSASATVGSAFSYAITASNSPTGFNATGLPGGLTVNTTTGVISGTPGSAGTSNVALSATNAAGTGTATLTLTVKNPPPPVPATPAGVTGFGWDSQVDLRWTASANATGYDVTRATALAGTYTLVGSNVAAPYFSDTAGLANGATYYYQVSALNASGASAPSAAVSVLTRAAGDNAWNAADIGTASTPGSADYGSGSYTLTSAGVDIWGTADACQFMSQPLTGDGAIVARVASVSNSSPYAKAGVTIRASLAANAANMAVFVSPGTAQGVTAQWRLSTGASSAQTLFTGVTAPYWVKLARAGSTFTAYRSTDGVNWTLQSTQTISMSGPVYAGLAVTAHNTGGTVCTAVFDSVSILPGPAWLADDVGLPAIDGFTAYSGGTLTVNEAGTDIWGTSDQLHYVYQPASGDCDITVRMTGVENSNASAKAGVMLRESLAANSAYVDLLATPNGGVYMQTRGAAGASTSDVTTNAALRAPYWLRLARVGNTVTGYTSPDGSTWTTLGATTVTMGASDYLGVAGTSHDATKLGTATLDNISVNP